MKSKPFYFRLEPLQLLSALIQIPEAERGIWITQVALELASGVPVDNFALSLFNEATTFKKAASERSRLAGLASALKRQQKLTDVQQTLTDVQLLSTKLNPEAVAVTKDLIPYREILDDLNSKGGFRYQVCEAVKKHINARFMEKYTKEDFFHVHAVKIAEWKDTADAKYLRPETLYGNKFQGYLNQKLMITKRIMGPDGMYCEVPV